MNGSLTDFGSSTDSVTIAYRPLAVLSKIYGVHPMEVKRPLSKNCWSRVDILFSTVLNGCLVLFTIGLVLTMDYMDVKEDNVLEYTTKLSFYFISICAIIHISSSFFKGPLSIEVQMMWSFIDKRLAIVRDDALRAWARKMVMFFLLLKLLFFGTSAAIVIAQRNMGDMMDALLMLGIVVLFVWHYCAILVPQFTYLFYCRAIQSRFAILGLVIQKLLGTACGSVGGEKGDNARVMLTSARLLPNAMLVSERDISVELEGLRHTYHLLAEITASISDLCSPMILMSFLIDSGMICTCMYRLIQMWEQERWSVPLELMAIITSILKIFAVTFLGSGVTSTAVETLQLLPKTSYRDKNTNSKYQIQLFALTSGNDEPGFSASGFFKIDRGLFTATVGTVATYFVILLQIK